MAVPIHRVEVDPSMQHYCTLSALMEYAMTSMVPSVRIFFTISEKVAILERTSGKKHARALILLAFKSTEGVEGSHHERVLCHGVVAR